MFYVSPFSIEELLSHFAKEPCGALISGLFLLPIVTFSNPTLICCLGFRVPEAFCYTLSLVASLPHNHKMSTVYLGTEKTVVAACDPSLCSINSSGDVYSGNRQIYGCRVYPISFSPCYVCSLKCKFLISQRTYKGLGHGLISESPTVYFR